MLTRGVDRRVSVSQRFSYFVLRFPAGVITVSHIRSKEVQIFPRREVFGMEMMQELKQSMPQLREAARDGADNGDGGAGDGIEDDNIDKKSWGLNVEVEHRPGPVTKGMQETSGR